MLAAASCAGNSNTCTGGFANFPTFGLSALSNPLYGWNFNFEVCAFEPFLQAVSLSSQGLTALVY